MNSETPSSIDTEIGPGEVGDLLRASRLRQGQELSDVARALRIRTVYLQAIEDCRYDDLPGVVYAIGFIRSYAEHLGLDGEQLVARFKSEASGQGRKPMLTFPTMVPENGIPRGAVVALGALILVGAYGGWYFLSSKDLYVTDLIPPVPETITRALEAGRASVAAVTEPRSEPTAAAASPVPAPTPSLGPVPNPVAEPQPPAEQPPAVAATVPAAPAPALPADPAVPAPTVEAPAVETPVAAAPAPSAVATPSVPAAASASPAVAEEPASEEDEEVGRTPPPSAAPAQPETAAQTSAQPGVPAEAPVAVLDDRGAVDAPAVGSQLANLPDAVADPDREIVLNATIDSWIQIRDTVDNKLVLTRLLRKGEQYTVPQRDGLTLVTGNAGGLEITVGGDATPSLGPLGVVRRNVALDPERLRAGTAIAE